MPKNNYFSLMPLVTLLTALASTSVLHAQTAGQPIAPGQEDVAVMQPDPAPGDLKRSLELNASAQQLTGGYGNWRDVSLRGAYGLPSQVLQGEISANRRFGKDGAFLGVSDTYTFNPDWYGSLAVGAGDGAFYLPRYRVDAAIYRKLLAERNLVSSFGVGYYNAPDGHIDRSVSLGLVYYFKAPFIAEGGVRFNSSNPGAIRTHQQFVALTWGHDRQDLVTGRYSWGGEGYLATSATTQLVNFQSHEASISWRHWLNARTGIVVGGNTYTNPLYRRTGLNAGVFHDF